MSITNLNKEQISFKISNTDINNEFNTTIKVSSLNIGGYTSMGQSTFTQYLQSIKDGAQIICLNEVKLFQEDIIELEQIKNITKTVMKEEYIMYVNCFSGKPSEELEQLKILEYKTSSKQIDLDTIYNLPFNRKGGQIILINKRLSEIGGCLQHQKPIFFSSKRITIINFINGWSIANIYGPAGNYTKEIEEAKDTYFCSKIQFINQQISKTLKTKNMIYIGDFNMTPNASSDKKDEQLLGKILEDNKLIDVTKYITESNGIKKLITYKNGSIKSAPDRLIMKEKL